MSYLAGVIFSCLAMALVVGMAYQLWAYLRGRNIISRRQLILRLTNGILLLCTIGLIFYTALIRISHPTQFLVLASLLFFLPVLVIILAWLDLRQVARLRHQRQAELYRQLAAIEEQLRRQANDGKDT